MFDINLKNVKKGKSFYCIFLIIGIICLLILGGVFISSIIKLNNLDATVLSSKVEIKSYVNSDGEKKYYPIYEYRVKGEYYSCKSTNYTSFIPEKQNKIVYYDSKNPSKCMAEHSMSANYIILAFLIIPLTFITVAVVNIKKINKRIKKIENLNKTGKLIKNLPYRLEDTGMVLNNVPIQRPVIEYTISIGNTITLYGDPRHDKKYYDKDGMVDLLIDENNPENYYIDFEINRLAGNLEEDYYQQNIQ